MPPPNFSLGGDFMAGPAIIGYANWGNNCVINLAKLDFDPDYQNVLVWPAGTGGDVIYNWFVSQSKYTYTEQTPVDMSKGYFDIQAPYYNITDMNYASVYLGAENPTDLQPFFWGLFITHCEQLALNTTRIYFKVDVMTTFQENYKILPPQIFLRYTPPSDNLFENLVPDPEVDIGDDTVVVTEDRTSGESVSVAILYSRAPSELGWPTNLGMYYGIPSGLGLKTFNLSVQEELAEFVLGLTTFITLGQEDAIAAMYAYPSSYGGDTATSPSLTSHSMAVNFNAIGDYTPKNKKLFSSPYFSYAVANHEGDITTYKPELFNYTINDNNTSFVTFTTRGIVIPSPQRLTYPENYRGMQNAYEDGIMSNACVTIPWIGDTFKAWLAQNGGSLVTSTLSSAMSGGFAGFLWGGLPGAALGARLAGASSVLSGAGKSIDKLNTPPKIHGEAMGPALFYALGLIEPDYFIMSLRPDVLERIDNYWSAYGYPINDIVHMNEHSITNRPHWVYIRTQNCHFNTANVQKEYADEICEVFNRGVRFWKSYSDMGNLDLDNSV